MTAFVWGLATSVRDSRWLVVDSGSGAGMTSECGAEVVSGAGMTRFCRAEVVSGAGITREWRAEVVSSPCRVVIPDPILSSSWT